MPTDQTDRNAAQKELWNGRGGEIWTRLQARLDRLFEPLTAAFLSAIALKPGQKLVEIGCGCGDLTFAAAKACGEEGAILGIDISARMLERAKSREAKLRAASMGMARIEWLEADAMHYHFKGDADLVISRFGVMFFADPVEAFINIRRALKPTGRLAVLCWAPLDQNPWINVPLKAVHELIEPPPSLPACAPGPFAFSDVHRVLETLNKAGFCDAHADYIECTLDLGRASEFSADPLFAAIDDALIFAMESGPVAALLRDADHDTHDKVRKLMAASLVSHFNSAKRCIKLDAACWIYRAGNS